MTARVQLRSDRLRLRKLGPEDLDALVELDSDPEVMRYLTDGVPNSRAYVEGMLARMLAWADDDPVGFYAAELRDPAGPEWIGWFHLRPSIDPEPGALELGYRLRRAVWGRGYATEGSRALAQLAVTELGATFVDGCARPDNLASLAVLRKCGLRFIDHRPHPRAPEIEVAFHRATPSELLARR